MASKSKKHERRRAREDALSLLYSSDIMESDPIALIESGEFPDDIEMGGRAHAGRRPRVAALGGVRDCVRR